MSELAQATRVILRDEFATKILGLPVYELRHVSDRVVSSLPLGRSLAYTKVDSGNVEVNAWLAARGWQFVETTLQMRKITSPLYVTTPPEINFRWAKGSDEDQAAAIARTSFPHSRWHRDSKISTIEADRLKEEWVRNYWRGERGSHMVVAEVNGDVVGFNQLIFQDSGTLIVDLIAVDPKWRRKGIGTGLLRFAESNLGALTAMRVGTQLSNWTGVSLYQRSGFAITRVRHTWHGHLLKH